jgi:hypothetical protein
MLKEIEKDFELGSSSYPPYINLTEKQVEWLIEQTKKVEMIEKENEELKNICRGYGVILKEIQTIIDSHFANKL